MAKLEVGLVDPSLLRALPHAKVPVLGFAAVSGTGKTTLLCRLIPLLRERQIKVGLIKHAHHDFDLDHPGKDSFELRKAGASPVLVASSRRRAIVTDHPALEEPRLDQELRFLDQEGLDLVLVEGFKRERFPKIELHRAQVEAPYQYLEDSAIVALVSDAKPPEDLSIPCLQLDDPGAIADFIVRDYLPEARREISLR